MGVGQSSNREPDGDQGTLTKPVKTCYYDLLGVERQASEDEIKKAYRRKALELHPDRNYSDAENATRKFADVQSAYEVLSDPQERAWYDSHREVILRNEDVEEDHFEHNVRLTSASEIINLISKFTKSIPFTDDSDGFYGRLSVLFSALAREEAAACEWAGLEQVEYPKFGGADGSYKDTVRPFYSAWFGFATKKTFSWLDEHNYTEARERRIRRLMEKENKRIREEGIKEFNDAVRSLVTFVRKRDPRYTPNFHSEAERQKSLRETTAAQAARSRAANLARIDQNAVPDWTKSQVVDDETSSEPEMLEEELHECVICAKTFKSENQYETHERSKKHIKAVQQLKRQMQKEDKLFNLHTNHLNTGEAISLPKLENCVSNPPSDPELVLPSVSVWVKPSSQSASTLQSDQLSRVSQVPAADFMGKSKPDDISGDISTSEDQSCDEYAASEDLEGRLFRLKAAGTMLLEDGDPNVADNGDHSTAQLISSASDDVNQGSPKEGKAKARRAWKAARQHAAVEAGSTLQCTTCGTTFGSKTRLFIHIKELGHAQPLLKPIKGRQLRR